MTTRLAMALQTVIDAHNEQGAEIVEWVLWVGGIAVLAGSMYSIVNTALSAKANSIMNSVIGIAS
jgi:hypothetical protein